jgi:hypothetical protein
LIFAWQRVSGLNNLCKMLFRDLGLIGTQRRSIENVRDPGAELGAWFSLIYLLKRCTRRIRSTKSLFHDSDLLSLLLATNPCPVYHTLM